MLEVFYTKRQANMTKQMTAIDSVKHSLSLMSSQFKMVLPEHIKVEKFIRVTQTAVQLNKSLLECDRNSLFAACIKASEDGLLPNGKEAALVPFKGQVQYMPMVAGILKKIRNSGELASITAQIVHEKDDFKYFIDSDGEHLNHAPNMFLDRGSVVGVYALAKMKDDSVYIEVMTMNQVNQVKNVSRAKDSNSSPWNSFPEEMMKKTVIRRLSKRLPMSTDIESTFENDNVFYDLKGEESAAQVDGVVTQVETKKETPRLENLIKKTENKKETKPEIVAETEVADEVVATVKEKQDVEL